MPTTTPSIPNLDPRPSNPSHPTKPQIEKISNKSNSTPPPLPLNTKMPSLLDPYVPQATTIKAPKMDLQNGGLRARHRGRKKRNKKKHQEEKRKLKVAKKEAEQILKAAKNGKTKHPSVTRNTNPSPHTKTEVEPQFEVDFDSESSSVEEIIVSSVARELFKAGGHQKQGRSSDTPRGRSRTSETKFTNSFHGLGRDSRSESPKPICRTLDNIVRHRSPVRAARRFPLPCDEIKSEDESQIPIDNEGKRRAWTDGDVVARFNERRALRCQSPLRPCVPIATRAHIDLPVLSQYGDKTPKAAKSDDGDRDVALEVDSNTAVNSDEEADDQEELIVVEGSEGDEVNDELQPELVYSSANESDADDEVESNILGSDRDEGEYVNEQEESSNPFSSDPNSYDIAEVRSPEPPQPGFPAIADLPSWFPAHIKKIYHLDRHGGQLTYAELNTLTTYQTAVHRILRMKWHKYTKAGHAVFKLRRAIRHLRNRSKKDKFKQYLREQLSEWKEKSLKLWVSLEKRQRGVEVLDETLRVNFGQERHLWRKELGGGEM